MEDNPNTVGRTVDSFEPWNVLSNRLAKVENSVLKQGDQLKLLTEQILLGQLVSNRTTHDLASATVESLDRALLEIHDQREELAKRRTATTDSTERMMLEMMDSTLAQREDRTRMDRNQALLRREKANEMVNDTNQKISRMRPGDQTLTFPPIQTGSPQSLADKALKWFIDNILKIGIVAFFVFLWEAVKYYVVAKINGTIP